MAAVGMKITALGPAAAKAVTACLLRKACKAGWQSEPAEQDVVICTDPMKT